MVDEKSAVQCTHSWMWDVYLLPYSFYEIFFYINGGDLHLISQTNLYSLQWWCGTKDRCEVTIVILILINLINVQILNSASTIFLHIALNYYTSVIFTCFPGFDLRSTFHSAKQSILNYHEHMKRLQNKFGSQLNKPKFQISNDHNLNPGNILK